MVGGYQGSLSGIWLENSVWFLIRFVPEERWRFVSFRSRSFISAHFPSFYYIPSYMCVMNVLQFCSIVYIGTIVILLLVTVRIN